MNEVPTAEVQPEIRFVCSDHSRIMDTVDELVASEATCNFCGAVPIVIVYRSWNDKIVVACAQHMAIVEEMIERDNT